MRTDNKTRPKTEKGSPGKCIRSDELLDGARQLLIEHRGEFYRLQLTAMGKLILTK